MTPEISYTLLLVVQMLHLLHHRLAKRHISYAEVVSSAVLCVPLSALPGWLLIGGHLSLIGIQIVGSLFIRRLSPDWNAAAG